MYLAVGFSECLGGLGCSHVCVHVCSNCSNLLLFADFLDYTSFQKLLPHTRAFSLVDDALAILTISIYNFISKSSWKLEIQEANSL